VEARAGAAIPVSSFADGTEVGEGTTAGFGFGFGVTLGSGGRGTLYAGFAQLRFGCEAAGCPRGQGYVATGVNAGVRVPLVSGTRLIPWLGAGIVTTRVETPGLPGSPSGVSKLGYGGEAAAGLFVNTGRSWALTPSLRWSRVGTELPGGARLSLRYLVADLGAALTF